MSYSLLLKEFNAAPGTVVVFPRKSLILPITPAVKRNARPKDECHCVVSEGLRALFPYCDTRTYQQYVAIYDPKEKQVGCYSLPATVKQALIRYDYTGEWQTENVILRPFPPSRLPDAMDRKIELKKKRRAEEKASGIVRVPGPKNPGFNTRRRGVLLNWTSSEATQPFADAIAKARAAGAQSVQGIKIYLNAAGIQSPRGGGWSYYDVRNMIELGLVPRERMTRAEAAVKGTAAKVAKANAFAQSVAKDIAKARAAGAKSQQEIADYLNAAGRTSPRGKKWTHRSVALVLARINIQQID